MAIPGETGASDAFDVSRAGADCGGNFAVDINTCVAMAGSIKAILNIMVVAATCVGVLRAAGTVEWGGPTVEQPDESSASRGRKLTVRASLRREREGRQGRFLTTRQGAISATPLWPVSA